MRSHPLPQVGNPSGGYGGRSAQEAPRPSAGRPPGSCPRCGGETLPPECHVDSVGATHLVRACLGCAALWVVL